MSRSSSPEPTSRRRGPGTVVALLGALAALDAAALLREGAPRLTSRLVEACGGLAPGHALTGAWSFHGLDARGTAACEAELQPLVGAPCPDPGHRHEPRGASR